MRRMLKITTCNKTNKTVIKTRAANKFVYFFFTTFYPNPGLTNFALVVLILVVPILQGCTVIINAKLSLRNKIVTVLSTNEIKMDCKSSVSSS